MDLSGIELTVENVITTAARLAKEVKKEVALTKDQKVDLVQLALRTSVAANIDLEKTLAEDIEQAIASVVPGIVMNKLKDGVILRVVHAMFDALTCCRLSTTIVDETATAVAVAVEATVPAPEEATVPAPIESATAVESVATVVLAEETTVPAGETTAA